MRATLTILTLLLFTQASAQWREYLLNRDTDGAVVKSYRACVYSSEAGGLAFWSNDDDAFALHTERGRFGDDGQRTTIAVIMSDGRMEETLTARAVVSKSGTEAVVRGGGTARTVRRHLKAGGRLVMTARLEDGSAMRLEVEPEQYR